MLNAIRKTTEKPKLILVYAFRYDAELVPDLIKNTRGFVDDYVFWDDRKNNKKWYHEGRTRRALIKMAIQKGADWIIAADHDERFEKGAGKKIRQIINQNNGSKRIYGFRFRELWKPKYYRCDGIWNEKIRYNLFPVLPDQDFMNLKLHSGWYPINPDYEFVQTDVNLYHLKMIDKKNREDRKNLYKEIDKGNKIQKIGYDYLTDESELVLKRIPFGRGYRPRYKNSYKIKQYD